MQKQLIFFSNVNGSFCLFFFSFVNFKIYLSRMSQYLNALIDKCSSAFFILRIKQILNNFILRGIHFLDCKNSSVHFYSTNDGAIMNDRPSNMK